MDGKRTRGGWFPLVLCIGLLVVASPAQARQILFLTGAEGGGGGGTKNYYTFAGAVAPVFGANLGDGPVQKYWLDFLGYDYPAGGREITATAVGVEGALGYQKGAEQWWGGAYAGVRYSHTWLAPDQPESRVRGSQIRPLLQIEGERSLGRDWKVNGIGRYLFVSDAYWTRARVVYRVRSEVYTGPELVVHGDPEYRAWQGGWCLTFPPLPGGSMGVKAGVRKVERAEQGIYLGVEFGRIF